MPMETSMPIGIRPVQQTKASSDTAAVTRRDGGSSPFAPQTNVNIENSIADMAGVLAKISSSQDDAVEVMPQQIKEMVENIMRQAFSVETTIGEGLGSTLESQRFSVEQLAVLARMLSQLASAGEKSGLPELSAELQNFLKCLRGYLSEENSSMEPVLLHKLAFQLLNAKNEEDIPKNLQTVLQTEEGETASDQGTDESGIKDTSFAGKNGTTAKLSVLRQLIKSFMPQAETARNVAAPVDRELQQLLDTPIDGETEQSNEKKTENLAKEQIKNSAAFADDAEDISAFNSRETGVKSKVTMAEEKAGEAVSDQDTISESMDDVSSKQSDKNTGIKNGQTLSGREGSVSADESIRNAKSVLDQLQQLRQQIADDKNRQQQVTNKTVSEPMANTPKTMETMKQLAGLLLKDAKVTAQEAGLLQQFVNGEQAVLSEKDAKQLQLLLRLCESNVPASVRQAAQQNNMPDLPRLWAFMELCDMASLKEQTPRSLKSASRSVTEFASAIKGQMEGESANHVEGQRSMNFMMPLYLGDNEQSYPAYIHVYDENKKQENSSELKKETWLRLCLLTENIGAVELTCRIYDDKKLDVRVFFSQVETVKGFQEYIPEFKASFEKSPLELADLKVGVAGAKL